MSDRLNERPQRKTRAQRRGDAALADQRLAELGKIHIAKKALGLSDDHYRDIIYGVMLDHTIELPEGEEPSAKFLHMGARRALLDTFKRMGWDDGKRGAGKQPSLRTAPEPQKRRKGHTKGRYYGGGSKGEAGFLTQQQADYIAHLEDLLDWTYEPKRLLRFIERQTGKKKAVPGLRNREASRVITGLERLAGIKPHPRSKRQQ